MQYNKVWQNRRSNLCLCPSTLPHRLADNRSLNLRVCLIRGLLDSPSIARYGDQILEAWQGTIRKLTSVITNSRLPLHYRLDGSAGITTQIVRYTWYPIKARRVQGDVNHITDHVHAYLLRHFRPTDHRYMPRPYDILHPENIDSTSLLPSIGHNVFQRSISCLHEAARVIAGLRTPEETSSLIHNVIQSEFEWFITAWTRSLPRRETLRVSNSDKSLHQMVHVYCCHVGLTRALQECRVRSTGPQHLDERDGTQRPADRKVGQEFTGPQRKLIQDLGLTNRIVHLGRLEASDLVVSYQSCDALLFPSIYEGFGWPPLEAMSCGTPVIASNTGSYPKLLATPQSSRNQQR